MRNCGCKPGTPENFWFEITCAECLEIERRTWARMMERIREEQRERNTAV